MNATKAQLQYVKAQEWIDQHIEPLFRILLEARNRLSPEARKAYALALIRQVRMRKYIPGEKLLELAE